MSRVALEKRQKLVLIVDDDPDMVKSLERLLSTNGFDYISFRSIEMFSRHQDFKSALCVLMDINLAGVSGLDVGRRLRQEGIFTPIIFMSGNDNSASRAAAAEVGSLAYLTKPFSCGPLIDLLEKTWNEQRPERLRLR